MQRAVFALSSKTALASLLAGDAPDAEGSVTMIERIILMIGAIATVAAFLFKVWRYLKDRE